MIQGEERRWHGNGAAPPELLEVFKKFDENIIDVPLGSWMTNDLVGWIVKVNDSGKTLVFTPSDQGGPTFR